MSPQLSSLHITFIYGQDFASGAPAATNEQDIIVKAAIEAANILKATPNRDCASDFEHNFLSD